MSITLIKKKFLKFIMKVVNLADFFLSKKIKKFIQIGSSIEYGKKSPHHEKMKSKNTYSYYGNAKLLSTNYLLTLYKDKKNFLPVY